MPNTMFLVLDMINDLVHEDGPNGKKGYGPILERRKVLDNTALAINKARAAGVKLGYVRVGFSPDYREVASNSALFTGAKNAGLFKLGTWGTEVHPKLAPKPGDYDIIKHRVSPFYATRLDVILSTNQITKLVLCGVSTTGAVLSAAKDGHDRDYDIVILDDCSAAASDEQHHATLEMVSRFAAISTAAQIQFA
ncbi:MAG: cysteine hydrolase [Betaproteobacteria bacterium]|nr:cysteine hydrolase [Betaproteobacteria bacterium]